MKYLLLWDPVPYTQDKQFSIKFNEGEDQIDNKYRSR